MSFSPEYRASGGPTGRRKERGCLGFQQCLPKARALRAVCLRGTLGEGAMEPLGARLREKLGHEAVAWRAQFPPLGILAMSQVV